MKERSTETERQNYKSKATHYCDMGLWPDPGLLLWAALYFKPSAPLEDLYLNLSHWEIITHIVLGVSLLTPAQWLIDCFTEPDFLPQRNGREQEKERKEITM